MIKHEDGKWVLYSRDGKRKLGTYDTEGDAIKRERVVAHFKEGYSDEALEARISRVRDAYYVQMGGWGVSPGEEAPWVQEIRDASVIVCKGQDYFEVPYTIAAEGAVSFGEPTKVDLTYAPVKESQATQPLAGGIQLLEHRLVEGQAPGSVWKVRIIAPGFSLNRSPALGLPRYYGEPVLREAAPRFEGVRAFLHEAKPHVARGERRGQDVVGWFTAPGFEPRVGIIGEFRCIDPPLRQKLTESFAQGKRDLLGFSINAEGREEAGIEEGVRAAIVRQIGPRIDSVDVVSDAAAGGEFIQLVASVDPTPHGGDPAMLEQLLEAIRKVRPDLVAKAPDGGWTVAKLEALLQEALKPASPPATDPALVTLTETVGQIQTALKESRDQNAQLGRQLLERDRRAAVGVALDASPIAKLAPARDAVVRRMAGVLLEADPAKFEAALKEAIDDQAKVVTALADQSGRVVGFGPATVSTEERDRWKKAMDGLFENADVDKVPRFRSIKQAYAIIVGLRGPADFVNPMEMLRESVVYQPATEYGYPNRLRESLTTTTWAEVLGDSITRRMIREYTISDLSTWRRLPSEINPARDFRTMRRPRFGGYGTLPIVGQGGTYNPLATPTDEEATYVIEKRGGTEDFTLEMAANDDVAALRAIPRKLGRAAAQTLFRFVMDFLVNNGAVTYDGVALFHASHGNLGAGALTDPNVKAAIQDMRNQAAYGDAVEILGGANAPRWLLVPNELEDMGHRLTRAVSYVGATNEAATTPNMIRDRYPQLELWVVDYWTDPTDYVLVADPVKQPTMEVGFYNGQEDPELFVQDQPTVGSVFTADKYTWKIRHIYGGAILDHRAFWKSVQ